MTRPTNAEVRSLQDAAILTLMAWSNYLEHDCGNDQYRTFTDSITALASALAADATGLSSSERAVVARVVARLDLLWAEEHISDMDVLLELADALRPLCEPNVSRRGPMHKL